MKIRVKYKQNQYPKTYYNLTFIDISWINTHQVYSLNITVLNLFLKITKTKKIKKNKCYCKDEETRLGCWSDCDYKYAETET